MVSGGLKVLKTHVICHLEWYRCSFLKDGAMGLDIKVFANTRELRGCLDDLDNELQKNEALRILDTMQNEEEIWTAPGSYSGLHVVRNEYAKLKGWPLDANGRYISDGPAEKSHLINHCDAQWYYLPVDFPEPQWVASTGTYFISIGSSVRLLSEVTELLAVKDKWPEGFQHRWDAVFLAAVASVACRVPIEFT